MRTLIRIFRRFWLPLALLIIVALVASAFLYGRHSVYRAHPDLTSQDQAQQVLAKVGKLITLPEGEAPSMATITDAETVKAGQPFLSKAQNGDILIVYPTAQTALLYRPSENKLIAVGPVTPAPVAEPPVQTKSNESNDKTATTSDSN